MPTFEYQAQSNDGQVVSGLVLGASLDEAASSLAGKGLQVLRIGVAASPGDPLAGVSARPVERPSKETARVVQDGPTIVGPPVDQRTYMQTSVWGPLVGKVPLSQLAFFFRQLGTMLSAGVPIVQTMGTLANQSASPKLRSILHELGGHVEAGRPISAGMQRYPEVFTPVMISIVRAGEEGGFLEKSLHLVADYIDREIHLRNLYRRLTFFPKLQIAMSILIVIGTNFIIASLGKKGGLSSPLTEPGTWIWLGPLIVALFLFFRVGLANPRVKHNWDTVLSNLPYVGKTLRQLSMAKFGRAFGALYGGGVPMQKAFELGAESCGNEYLRSRMRPAYRQLETGAGLTETLSATGAFSPIVLDMVSTGERTGNLDFMLMKTADFYEQEAETRSTQTALIVGVVLGLVVAVYIGYVVITFYMGYYGGMMSGAGQG